VNTNAINTHSRSPLTILPRSAFLLVTWGPRVHERSGHGVYPAPQADRRKRMTLAEARLLARQLSQIAQRRRQKYLEEESERERIILAAAYDL
jgi:hypothetical protein